MGGYGLQVPALVCLLRVLAGDKGSVQGAARGVDEVTIRAVPEAAVEYGDRASAACQMYLVRVIGQGIGYVVGDPAGFVVAGGDAAGRRVSL